MDSKLKVREINKLYLVMSDYGGLDFKIYYLVLTSDCLNMMGNQTEDLNIKK